MNEAKTGQPTVAKTGVAGLDDILNGGLTPHGLYLVEGDPGAGKTTLGLQFLLEGIRVGEAGIYVTLSESKEELTAIAASHGWSLESIGIFELIPSEQSLRTDEQYTMFHPSETELGETTNAILAEMEQTRPRRVVFDSLSEMRLLAQNPLRYRRQILALKHFFAGRKCTVVLLDDRTSEGSNLQLQSLAHGALDLQQASPEYGVMRRRLRVLKMRGKSFRTGYHDFVIERGGLRVFPRLIAAEHHKPFGAAAIASGVGALDDLLGGDLERGSSTLVMGPSGSGKSSIGSLYAAAAAARGEHAAFFLFDETQRTLLARSKGLGLDLGREVDAGRIRLQQVDPGELSPGEFVHSVRESVDHHDTRIVVIDSLNGYMNAMPEVRFLALQLHELLTYLGQVGVTTILIVAQHGLVGPDMQAPVDLSYLADTVILLRYFEAVGKVRRAVSVIKKRSGAHEDSIREFRLDRSGIHVGQPLEGFQGVLTGLPTFTGASAALMRSPDDKQHVRP